MDAFRDCSVVVPEDGITRVHLHDSIAAKTSAAPYVDLLNYVHEQQPPRLVVDFSEVTIYGTSLIVGPILRLRAEVEAYRGKLILCGMSPMLRQVYTIMKLDGTMFLIHDTQEEAIAAMNGSE